MNDPSDSQPGTPSNVGAILPLDFDDAAMQRAIKLESIFTPETRKQRDELYRKQHGTTDSRLPVQFVHYTSAEAAFQIIRTKRIWMRNTTCMTDYREVQHGFEFLHGFFEQREKVDAFIAALDSCVPGAAKEAISLFDQWWKTIYHHTHIASVSEHDREKEDFHGRLSMWRAFGGQTARVAIVLNVPWFSAAAEALGIIFSPVAYLDKEKCYAMMDAVMTNIAAERHFLSTFGHKDLVGAIFRMLVVAVTCLKHEGFGEELEWRAIYSPKMSPSPLMEYGTEVIGGVPQLVYKLPLDSAVSPTLASIDLATIFDRLIIGPSQFPSAMYEAFVEALTGLGVQNPGGRVWTSLIPIRS